MNVSLQHRRELYTNPDVLYSEAKNNHPYLRICLDTWYVSEWTNAQQAKVSTLGSMDLTDGPISAKTGIDDFVCTQISIVQHAFEDILRIVSVNLTIKPLLSGVKHSGIRFNPPISDEDYIEIKSALQNSTSYVVEIRLPYDLQAVIRDEKGDLMKQWLPDAGAIVFHCQYYKGHIVTPPTISYILLPQAERAYGLWSVDFECNVSSLFQHDNSQTLRATREQWKALVEGKILSNAETSHILTLIDPP